MADQDGAKRIVDTDGGAYVEGNASVTGGDFIGRDKVIINLPPEPPPLLPRARKPPANFVQRPDEYKQVVARLLDETGKPMAGSVALIGTGGYGKTTLVQAICDDERIKEAFTDDGIIWIDLGQTPNVLGQLTTLYGALAGERQTFVKVEEAANALAQAWGNQHRLVVVDDVWDQAHLRPFLRGGSNCAWLMTTRNSDTLPPDRDFQIVRVDAMKQDEATALLGAGLPKDDPQVLRPLAARLGEWPLLLRLVNGVLKKRVSNLGKPLPDALAYVERRLKRHGLTAFDASDTEERDRAVAITLGISLDLLSQDESKRYGELAVFAEDVDIPLSTLGTLWGMDDPDDVEDLCVRLDSLSLLQECDLSRGSIRLHDVVRAFLVREQGDELRGLHSQLLDAYALGHWADLPADEPYLWHYLAYHQRAAGRCDELYTLLLDPDWMEAKLEATDVIALLADYDVALESVGKEAEDLSLVQGAIRLSAHVLAQDQAQLCSQLYARLLPLKQSGIRDLEQRLRAWQGRPWLRLLSPTLMSPGGALLRTLYGHTVPVLSVAVTADGKRAVSGSADETLKVWDLESGTELRTLSGHTALVSAVAVTTDGKRAVSGSFDRTLRVWDLESGTALRTLPGHAGEVRAVAVTADGKRAVSGSDDHMLKVWDLESGTELRTLHGHTSSVMAVAVTADGKRAVSGSADHTLKVWSLAPSSAGDLESGTALRTLSGHTSSVIAVAVTADGKRAVSGSNDKTLKVWDLESGTELCTLPGHTASVRAVAVTADGKRAVSGSLDHTLKVWDLESGTALCTLYGHTDWVLSVAVTADGKRAVSGSNDKTLKVWSLESSSAGDLESGTALRTLPGHTYSVRAVAVTADGKRAVSGSNDKTLKVWSLAPSSAGDLESGTELCTLPGHTASVRAVAVTADGKRAVSGSDDHTLKVWDLESGTELCTLPGHTASVRAVAVTADGKRAVSGSLDQTLRVWDLESGTELRALPGDASSVFAVAVTADGKRAVSGSFDHMLKVWDLESGTKLRTLSGHTVPVLSVAVTANGKRAVSGSAEGTLKVWSLAPSSAGDLESGTELRTLSGHADSVWAVAVTADGKRAMSGSDDHTLKVWDLESGKLVATFSAEGELHSCAIARDGTIVTGGASGQVHFLRLENCDL